MVLELAGLSSLLVLESLQISICHAALFLSFCGLLSRQVARRGGHPKRLLGLLRRAPGHADRRISLEPTRDQPQASVHRMMIRDLKLTLQEVQRRPCLF